MEYNLCYEWLHIITVISVDTSVPVSSAYCGLGPRRVVQAILFPATTLENTQW